LRLEEKGNTFQM
jgi:hypothetical protein